MIKFRLREQNLKKKWVGKNDMVPVNAPQYLLATEEQEENFFSSMYPTEKERKEYNAYREEWYRRAKEFDPGSAPLSLNLELVSTCNLACTMCYTITDKFQNSVIGAQRMLPWKIVKSYIDEAAEIGVKCISFSWRGESTLYTDVDESGKKVDFSDALRYAREKNILEIDSLTHGQLIDEKMAEKIVLAEPCWINFSIDGLEKEYNKIRTPPDKFNKNYNAFEKVTNSIKLIVKYKKKYGKKRPQIRTNTIFPAIKKDPLSYKKYMEKIGVNFMTVNEICDYRHHELKDESIKDDWACQFPFQRLAISANGIILPCTGAYNEEEGLVLGKAKGSKNKTIKDYKGNVVTSNLQDLTIKEAWHSEKINKIRKLHSSGNRKLIEPGCRNCHHGAVKHGADHLPREWDETTQQWKEHDHLSEKRKYKLRGKNTYDHNPNNPQQ